MIFGAVFAGILGLSMMMLVVVGLTFPALVAAFPFLNDNLGLKLVVVGIVSMIPSFVVYSLLFFFGRWQSVSMQRARVGSNVFVRQTMIAGICMFATGSIMTLMQANPV